MTVAQDRFYSFCGVTIEDLRLQIGYAPSAELRQGIATHTLSLDITGSVENAGQQRVKKWRLARLQMRGTFAWTTAVIMTSPAVYVSLADACLDARNRLNVMRTTEIE